MQHIPNKQRKIGWLALTTLVFIIIAGVSVQSFLTKNSAAGAGNSVEVGFTSLSPQGETGGAIIPASCESGLGEGGVAHWQAYWTKVQNGGGDGDTYSDVFVPADTSSASCTKANSCGMKSTGITYCNGSCSAVAPAESLCTTASLHICPSSGDVTKEGPGNTLQLQGWYTPAGTSFTGCPPNGSSNRNDDYTWSSDAPGTASVTNYTGGSGLVTGKAVGNTRINISYAGLTAFSTINVGASSIPASLHICPDTAEINQTAPGNTVLLKGYDTPAGTSFTSCDNPNGTNRNDRYTWKSKGTSIATVNNNTGTAGWVTGAAPGTVTITADYADIPGVPTATATIKVKCNPTDSCSSTAQQTKAATTCTGDTFTFRDSCNVTQTCNGTRSCNFNWTEVAP